MAGLLSDVLPFIYSRSNALKRNVNSLLDSPIEYLKQGLGQGNDDARVQNGLLAAAVKEKGDGPANQALQNQTNSFVMNSLGPLATVWHGSPHKFTKFDASKIGTGEGAQAYGHGLYLAESPSVAQQYKTALSGPDTTMVGGKALAETGLSPDAQSFVNQAAAKVSRGGKLETEIANLELLANSGHPSAPQMQEAVKALKGGVDRGQLYKVDLPDEHIAKMLDWDKPLSEQHPDVQSALGVKHRDFAAEDALFAKARELGVDPASLPEYKQLEASMDSSMPFTRTTGAMYYNDLGKAGDAAEQLRKQGIPGIRYLDGGSRGTGAGTSNFVVFPGNEGLLTILERNGQPVNQLSGLLGY